MLSTPIYVAAILAILAIYLAPRIRRRLHYASALNRIPGPRSYPVIGTTWLFMGVQRDQLHQRMREAMRPFPVMARTWLGSVGSVEFKRAEQFELILGANSTQTHSVKNWMYMFVRPWLGRGLLTADTDASWHAHRKLITPTFHFSILEGFCEVFAEQSAVLVAKMLAIADGNEGKPAVATPMYPLITLAALDMITETGMGVSLGVQKEPSSEYVQAVYTATGLIVERGQRPWHHAGWMYALSANGRRFEQCRRIMHGFTEDVIRKRRTAMLAEQSKEAKAATAASDANANEVDDMAPKKRLAFLDLLLQLPAGQLTDAEIREEVDTFMFAGHDTTTASLSWTVWLLANHPDVQERVYEEQVEIFGAGSAGRSQSATMRDLNEMKYLDRVLKESLRLYPSAPVIGRKAGEEVHVDGYVIPAGTQVELHIHALHRDERWFPQPDRFDPERFAPENMVGRPAYAYVPFSAGARNCVGQKFAQYEEKAVISALVRQLRFRVADGVRVEDERQVLEITVKPARGAPVIVERRK